MDLWPNKSHDNIDYITIVYLGPEYVGVELGILKIGQLENELYINIGNLELFRRPSLISFSAGDTKDIACLLAFLDSAYSKIQSTKICCFYQKVHTGFHLCHISTLVHVGIRLLCDDQMSYIEK